MLSHSHRQGNPLRITMALPGYLQRCMGLVHVVLILVMDGSHTHLIDALLQAGRGGCPDPAPCSSKHLDDKAGNVDNNEFTVQVDALALLKGKIMLTLHIGGVEDSATACNMSMHEMALTDCMRMQGATASAAAVRNRSKNRVAAPVQV